MENTFELVMIPSFGISTAGTEIEVARRVAAHDPRISVVILITDNSEAKLEVDEDGCISMVRMPSLPKGAVETNPFPPQNITDHMEAYKPVVKDIILKRLSNGNRRLAGFILDIFCSPMADLANELGMPFYFVIPNPASTAAFFLHFEGPLGGMLPDVRLPLHVGGFQIPLPESAWPVVIRNKYTASLFLKNIRRIRESKGILVVTLEELEPNVIGSLSQDPTVPPVYPVGPILNLGDVRDSSISVTQNEARNHLFEWLDAQPPRSVVFLCFGTRGAFNDEQVREIAVGLERSGHRFLWSLRRKGEGWQRSDYEDFNEVLPEGFLERTNKVGRVVRWVPQIEVLAHPAIGSLVNHGGSSSLLECMWFEVPVALWPLFADQHMCAYYWAKEAKLGTEMFMDDSSYIDESTNVHLLTAEEVENGIRRVMVGEEAVTVRNRLAHITPIAKTAHLPGGSAHRSITNFVKDAVRNVSFV